MDDEGSLFPLDDEKMPPTDWVIYNLRRTYYKNKSSPDLKKYFFCNSGYVFIASTCSFKALSALKVC